MAKFTDKISLSLIKKVIIIAICVGFVLFSGISAAVSWFSYRDYYIEMLERKSVFDEANATPVTVMNGITIECAEGVEFFDNGKAAPTKSSFVVKGLYNVSGRDYEEELSDFDIDIPEDFAENGGTVSVSYLHEETKIFEEKKEIVTENGTETVTTPVEKHFEKLFTASIDISLTAVKPDKLVITGEPYTVCYLENSLFDKTGLTAIVAYNDGSVYENVKEDDISVVNNVPLKTDVTQVELSYSLGGVTVKGFVPVKVMSEADYSDGGTVDIYLNGEATVYEGAALSTTQADVVIKYGNGNIVRLDDAEYTKSFGAHGNDEIARLGENYVMNIETEDGIGFKTGVTVISLCDAERAVLSNCETENIGDVKVISGISNGSSIQYSVVASESAYVDIYADMSNGYIVKADDKYYAQSIAIDTFMQVYVNDALKATESSALSVGGPYDDKDSALASMSRVHIGRYYVNEGENTIKVVFRNNTLGLKDCDESEPFGKIEALGISAKGGKIFNSFSDYLATVNETYSSPVLNVTLSRSWQNMLDPYILGSASDGTYIYYAVGKSVDPKPADDEVYKYQYPIRLVKYDPQTNEIMGYSSEFMAYSSVQWAHFTTVKMFCKNGYVYTFDADAQPVKIGAEALEANGANGVEAAPEITFTEESIRMFNDLQFCTAKQKYVAVGTDGYAHIYDSEMNVESYFKTGTSTPFRVTVDKQYIYVMSGTYWDNGNYKPVIYVYDWEGTLENKLEIDLSKVAGVSGGDASERGFVQVGTSLYISVRGWRDPWSSAVFKVDFDYGVEQKTEKLGFGAYVEACESKGVSMKYTAQAVNTSRINGLPNYVHGFCTDGTYFYVSANEEKTTKIYKVDAANKSVLGYTETYERSDTWNNADYIYYKDGYVYIVKYDGKGTIARVKCSDINKDVPAKLEEVEGGIQAPEGKTFKSVTYNITRHNYAAILTNNTTLCIYDGATNDILVEKTFSYHTMLGTYCDENYIYALYETSASAADKTTAGIIVFDWMGNLVKDVSLKGIHGATSNVNVQGMCVKNGEIYVLVDEWATNGMFVVKLNLDYSVLA